MTHGLFFKGLILGLAIAAPVGPIGILCVQRTLHRGQFHGFISGLGAATADAAYGFVAAFGLTFIANVLTDQMNLWQIVGGIFLGYLGIKTFSSTASARSCPLSAKSLGKAYLSTFLLTLTNPMTIFSFAAIFAGLGLTETQRGYGGAGLLVLGVFSGSGLWWLLLSSGIGLLKDRFNGRALRWVNRSAGIIIAGLGAIILFRLLVNFI
ncbi:MAG: LysE family transporter [Anaerolineae bacterium]|nr:LysE family transporter [Anaerolineae bacterium]